MPQAPNMSNRAPRGAIRMDCIQAALEFERDLARLGTVPDITGLPHIRARPVFEIVGAFLLALGVAAMSLAGSFVVFNLMLHLHL